MRARFILLGEKIEDRTQKTTNVAPSFRVGPSRQIEFTLNEQQAKRGVDCEAAFSCSHSIMQIYCVRLFAEISAERSNNGAMEFLKLQRDDGE